MMMPRLLVLFIAAGYLLIAGCNSRTIPTEKNVITDTSSIASSDTVVQTVAANDIVSDDTAGVANGDYAYYYVVVADTNTDYYTLRKQMFAINNQLGITIDTMGRYYNKTKDRIVLPDDDEDEMYAGEYFPRRDLAENLSLDYLMIFKENADPKTIALVTGIYEQETEALKALNRLKPSSPKAFSMRSKIFIGCMH